jgi:transposase-like protein
MVAAVRQGQSQRNVARQFGVSLATVQFWLQRAQDLPLGHVDWEDNSHAPHQQANQTPQATEERILKLRQELAKGSDLGEYGAQAIRRELLAEGANNPETVPSLATINRILKRHGVFDGRKRVRRPPPPPGWYLPEVAHKRADIDETDYVEDLSIEGGPTVCVLNTISLHGGWCASWPALAMRAAFVRECLIAHWRTFGLPDYAQFDNGTVFAGPHVHPDTVGSVTRLCLSLQVTPVFAVPREFGIQSAIESYNNRWQQKVWQRFHVADLQELTLRSDRYVQAVRQKNRQRFSEAPSRRVFPHPWREPSSLERRGCLLYLRRTSGQGTVALLGHEFWVSSTWLNRLVRCEVDLSSDVIRVYGLRRQEPQEQPLLREWPYRLPDKNCKHPPTGE